VEFLKEIQVMVPMIIFYLSLQYLVYLFRLISEVRKTQHQNPEFGHTESEIQKQAAKTKLNI
jgi:hypothetical protein